MAVGPDITWDCSGPDQPGHSDLHESGSRHSFPRAADGPPHHLDRSAHLWVFDCDGVLLDSNQVKSAAFHAVTLRYGIAAADDVLAHHQANGGVSRFVKFRRLFDEVLERPALDGELDGLLSDFASASRDGLAAATLDGGAQDLLRMLKGTEARVAVASGGLEEEVVWALHRHGIADAFDEIHGSPRSKSTILDGLLDTTDCSPQSTVLVGDSLLDMEVAADAGVHRVFVSHWTEFADWYRYVETNGDILVVEDLAELLEVLTRRRPLPDRPGLDWVPSIA